MAAAEELLLEQFAPVWEQEEQQRSTAWTELLLRNTIRESGQAYNLPRLAELGLQDVITQAQNSSEHELSRTVPALVQSGFPRSIRGLGWKLMLDVSVRRHRGHYAALVQQALGDLADKASFTAEEVRAHVEAESIRQQQELAAAAQEGPEQEDGPQAAPPPEQWAKQARGWLQQIEKDLPRTFSGHPVMEGGGKRALRRVLAAFAMHDPKVGYCQGMNFIAAVLLMYMSEEDAFWCLVIVVEDVLHGYFAPDMMATKVDQRLFQQLVSSQLPAVAVHLDAVGADIACVFAQWFLCAFVNSLPLETCLRVWDVLFYRKTSALLFQVGLALVDVYSEALLAAADVLDAFQVVQGMAALTHDASHLLAVAMVKFGALDEAQLAGLRQQAQTHVEREEAEEERLEVGRQQRQQQQQQAEAAKQQAGAPAADTGVSSVVRKLLARALDKRGAEGLPGAAAAALGAKQRPPGDATAAASAQQGPSGDSDSDAESGAVRGPAAAAVAGANGKAAGRPQGARAGNHTVPDSNDSPLLKVAAPAQPAAGAQAGAEAGGAAQHEAGEEPERDGEQGSYEPPTVPLFPEARELISLSPAESSAAAVPDIDDLLRASSLRRANNALAAAQPQHPLTAPPPPAAGGGAGAAAGEGPYADLLDLAGPSGDATGGGAAVQRPPTPGGLARSASHTRHASVAEEGEGPDGTQLAGTGGGGLRADHKLKQVDAMLWDDQAWPTPATAAATASASPAAQQATDAAQEPRTSSPAAAAAAVPRSDADAPAQPAKGGSAEAPQTQPPQSSGGGKAGAPGTRLSAGPQASGPSASSGSGPASAAPLSRAMQLAVSIALKRPATPHPRDAGGATTPPPHPRAPSPVPPSAAPANGTLLAANGVAPPSAGAAASSSFAPAAAGSVARPALAAGQVPPARPPGQSAGGAASTAAELNDWVELHVAGTAGDELLHASPSPPTRPTAWPAAYTQQHQQPPPQHASQPGGSAGGTGQLGGPAASAAPATALRASQHTSPPRHAEGALAPAPAPLHGNGHSGAGTAASAFGPLPGSSSNISSGWVDGALPPLPGAPQQHAMLGAPPPLPALPLLGGGVGLTLPHLPPAGGGGLLGSLPQLPLLPLDREGASPLHSALATSGNLPMRPSATAHVTSASSSGVLGTTGLMELGRLAAGLPSHAVGTATAEAVAAVCEREGIQSLLAKGLSLNALYKRTVAGGGAGGGGGGAAGGAHGSDDSDDEHHHAPPGHTQGAPSGADPLLGLPLGGAALGSGRLSAGPPASLLASQGGGPQSRPLDTLSQGSVATTLSTAQPPTSAHVRQLQAAHDHVAEALALAQAALPRTPRAASSSGMAPDGEGTPRLASPRQAEANAGGQPEAGAQPPHPAQQQRQAQVVFLLQVTQQQVSEALEDARQADQAQGELLRGYRRLSNAACQKLHDVARALADRDDLIQALSHKMAALTQAYASKEEQLIDRLAEQQEQIDGLEARLAALSGNTSTGGGLAPPAAAAAGASSSATAEAGSRILGALQKLRGGGGGGGGGAAPAADRTSRPESPPPATAAWAGLPLGGRRSNPSNTEVEAGTVLVQAAVGAASGSSLLYGTPSVDPPAAGQGGNAGSQSQENRISRLISRFMPRPREDGASTPPPPGAVPGAPPAQGGPQQQLVGGLDAS